MMKEDKLYQLRTIPEITYRNELFGDLKKWEKAGCPMLWMVKEEKNGYEAQVDYGHGYMRLLKDGIELERTGGNTICVKDCFMINRDYFGLPKYLWF